MPTLASALNQEIRRLARKEIRSQMGATKSAAAQHGRDIAELKRQVRDLRKQNIPPDGLEVESPAGLGTTHAVPREGMEVA